VGEGRFAVDSAVAGLFASVACRFGVLPLAFVGAGWQRRVRLGYAFAGGLMVAASVYNLLMPAFTLGGDAATELRPVLMTLGGLLAGCATLSVVRTTLTPQRLAQLPLRSLANRQSALVFLAMTVHSFPEGVAVGVGYGAETHLAEEGLGFHIAVAIAIHNMPEGLAVALPMHAAGASLASCLWYSFLTSLPQPIAAVPAALLVWLFEPLMLPMLGFAAGAMMFLVVVELLPDALADRGPVQTAWAFMLGFTLMVLVQVVLSIASARRMSRSVRLGALDFGARCAFRHNFTISHTAPELRLRLCVDSSV
jgi:ZIP family zinc transporter